MKTLLLLSVLVLAACSSVKPGSLEAIKAEKEEIKKEMAKTLDNTPKWYLTPPKDNTAVYEKAVARSRDMQMAVNKAHMLARAQLAIAIQGEINATMRLFMDEVGYNPDVSNNASIVTSQDALLVELPGVEQEDAKLLLEGDRYVAYVLIKYPVGEMNKVMVDRIHQNNALTAKLRASKAFTELERKVENEKFRQDKLILKE
jgi:hypothetical protein